MKRISILLVLLAFGVAACGEQASSQSDAPAVTPSATAEATDEPTTAAEPSDEPSETDDGGGSSTALADMIPDELNGVPGTSVPGMEQILTNALASQGMDAGDAEFAFVTYGEGSDAIILNAFRIPGIPPTQLDMLARMLSGAGTPGQPGVDAETVTVGGKSVLRMTPETGAGATGVVFLYFADDAVFTIISPSTDTSDAEALLAELP